MGSTGLIVGFRGIMADSRCAVDVVCVWEGDAEASVPVAMQGGESASLVLHTAVDPDHAAFHGFTITLLAVTPENHAGQRIEPDRYTIRLRVDD